jgi:hypothetical protein
VATAGRVAAVRSGSPDRWRDPVAASFGAVVVVAVTQAVTGSALGPLRAAVPYAAAGGLVLVARWAGVPNDERRGRAWLRATALVLTALGVWTSLRFALALPVGVGDPSGFYRVKVLVTSPLGDHNTAAGLLLVGVVASVVLARDDRRWWVAAAVTAAGVVACLSRGAAVVLVAVGLVGLVAPVRRPVAAAVAAVGAAVLVAVTALAFLLGASAPPGAAEPDGPLGASVLGRVDLAVRGVEVFADHPALGVGLGGFGSRTSDLPPPNDHAHNTFAHAGAEGGVVALVAVVVVVVTLAVRAFRAPQGWRRDVAFLGGGALVAHGQIDVLGGLLGHEVLLAVLATLVAAPVHASAEPPRVDRPG